MDIKTWLKNFKDNWQKHNINGVLELFDKNVLYYETPSIKIENFEILSKEWETIRKQDNISLDFEIFSSVKNRHSVIWKLQYANKENIKKEFSGTYLIELNKEGKCTFFHHCCESI